MSHEEKQCKILPPVRD